MQKLAELEAQNRTGGNADRWPRGGGRQRPLEEHLADFEADLKAEGVSSVHIDLKINRIRRILDGCRMERRPTSTPRRAALAGRFPGLAGPSQNWTRRKPSTRKPS